MKFTQIVLVAVVLGALVGGYRMLHHPSSREQVASKDIYYCPMHPEYTSDRAGTCPICNMNLVKRKTPGQKAPAQKVAGYAPVVLDNHQQQLIGVKTVNAERKPVTHEVQAIGTMAHGIDLYKVQDEYIRVYQDYINVYGDYRRIKDRRRIREEDRQLQLQVLETEHKLIMLGLSEEQITQLREVKRGQVWNQPEVLLFKDSDNYWVFAQIYENDLGFVTIGQTAEIEVPAYHERMQGIVRAVGGAIDPDTRTARAIIEMQGHRGELAADMLAYVRIPVDLDMNLVVPRDAVMDLGTRKVVFVEQSAGVFEPVEVQVGFQNDQYWSIVKGVKEGQKVVANGNFLLDSESRLRSLTGGEHVH